MPHCSLLDRAARLETQYRDVISQADEVRERIHILRSLEPATGSDSRERDLLLVRALLDQYHQHNSTELLQEVVELCTKGVECSSYPSKAMRNQLLCYLGVAHALLFFDLRRFEDCHAALSVLAESRQHLAQQDPLHVLCVSHHSATLLNEWSMTRNDGLGRAFSLLRTIADECTSDHQYRDVYLETLGRLCLAQWSETREGSLLDQAVAAYDECLLIRGDEGCRAINALNGLIVVKQRTSDVTNNPEKLVDIITRARQALSQGIDDSRATYTMVLLAGLLSMNACRGDNPAGFREAKDLAYTSVQRYKDTDYGKYGALHTLSAVLEDWVDFYDADEVPLDIVDEIVRTQRQVVAFCPPGHTWHERAAIHLVTAYLRRHRYYRDPADLIAAVEVARSTLSTCPEGMHGHASCLYHLARALLQCYEEWSKPSDLSDAIACFDELEGLGQDAWDDGPPHIRCHVLAQALQLRYSADNNLADLDRAISLLHQALDILPLDSRMRRPYTMDLVAMFRERFVHTRDSNDAKAASNTLARLLDTMPTGDSTRALVLVAKARLLVTPGFPGYDVLEAVKLQQAALRDNYRHPQMRLAESLGVLSLCKNATQACHPGQRTVTLELLSAYRSAIQLLPRMASFGLSLHSRFVVLARARTLAAEATLLALELGHICEALEMLEEGRAVFWAQYLRLRTTFDALPREQATHLRQLTRDLTLGDSDSRGPIGDNEIIKRRTLNADFEEALASARQLPGFERLLMGQTYSSLSQAARNGPVVVFVSSGTHTVAFVVPAPDVTPISVALPNINEDRLKAMISAHRVASARSAERLREARSMRPVRIRDSGDQDGECELLANLWSWVMLPVVKALNLRVSCKKDRPRVFLCPTGAFTFLPLHAAGLYNGFGSSCMDFFVSSYTPTLEALVQATDRRVPIKRKEAKILLASVRQPFQGECLLSSDEEAQRVVDLSPTGSIIQRKGGDGGGVGTTTEASDVLRLLPDASIMHLASHGVQDARDPLNSGFIMQDRLLTVQDLMNLSLQSAFLAFLSACETAKGDAGQPDQAVHLSAAMLYAGFTSVIGTMWSMGDIDGPLVAETVYRQLFAGDSEYLNLDVIPYALDDAVRILRDTGLPPSRWAPYVYIGA